MSKRIKAVERVKTALIALLAVSALLLGWRTRLFNEIFSAIPLFGSVANLVRSGTGPVKTDGVTLKEAARPLVIVITNAEGERYCAKYDVEARNSVYDRVSSIMSEALGSASEPSIVSEDEWRGALNGLGVYFEYLKPVGLSVLDGWLDAHMPDSAADIYLRRMAVVIGEDKSRIYYQDHGSGLFYGADTASASAKAQELEIYNTNGAKFAFELDTAGSVNAPYMILMPGRQYSDIRAASAGGAAELLDITLAAAGHEGETYTTFVEADGSLRRVGTQFNIRTNQRGWVMYRNTEGIVPGNTASPPGVSEMIERARIIAADTAGGICGWAEVFYDTIEYGRNETVSILFSYYIAGGSVFLPQDSYAVRVTFASGTVMEIEINFRSFSYTGEYTNLLPEIQALAAADGEFMLCYSDTGAEKIQPAWVVAAG